MALIIADRVLETCAAPGTGTVSLLGAVTGYQTFAAAIGNANTCFYTIADQSGANWEVGVGTVTTGAPNTLARTTILASSNAGSTVNFSSGTQNVFVTYPAEKAVYLNASGNVSALGTIGSATWNATTIGSTYGGTGVNNGSYTITLGGNISTAGSLTTSGANALTLTTTGSTNVTLPTSGTLVNTAVTSLSSLNTVGTITSGTWNGSAVTSGYGGTGFSSYATGDIIYASATNTLSKLAAGTNGYVLTLAGGVPTWAASTGGVTSFTAGTTGLTPSTATTGAITLSGTLATSNGGTGLSGATPFTANGAVYASSTTALTTGTLPAGSGGTSFSTYATGDIIYASATNTLSKLAAGTNGYVLTLAGGVPTWAAGGGGSASITVGTTTVSSGTNGYILYNNSGTLGNLGTTGTAGSVVLSNTPTLTSPVLGTPTSGTLSNCTVDGTDSVGFRNIPINSQSAAYTLVLADSGKAILHPSTDANARTFTIPANGTVAYPIGTAITFINMTSQVVTIAITTDTMYLAGLGTTGSRSLAQYGTATAIKMTSTTWIISGAGLT